MSALDALSLDELGSCLHDYYLAVNERPIDEIDIFKNRDRMIELIRELDHEMMIMTATFLGRELLRTHGWNIVEPTAELQHEADFLRQQRLAIV